MYVYGKNVAHEVLKNPSQVRKVYLNRNFKDDFIMHALHSNRISIQYLDKLEMDQMIDGNHQGIILKVPDYEYVGVSNFYDLDDAFLVILDHLEDPHNFGAIIRTCEAAGVDGIVIPKDRSVGVNSTVMKVSAGALENMQIACVTNLRRTIDDLKKQGFWIIGTDMDGTSYTEIDYRGKIAIVIGNEGSGMSRLISESCDFVACIDMLGKINSLNASVAAGIVIYQAVQGRK